MSELVSQLNASWRVVVLSDRDTWRRRAWSLEELVDGVWTCRAAMRTSEGLRALVKRYAGHVDGDAAVILAALPERVDLRVRESTIAAAPGIIHPSAKGNRGK